MTYQWPYIPNDEMYNEKMDTRNEILRAWAEKGAGKIVPNSWNHVQELVRAGLHNKVFHIRDQLTCQKSSDNLVWDIIGVDHDTPSDPQYTRSMTLQLHDQFPTALQFDAPEAFYYCEDGLAAGTYYFTIDSNYDPTNNDLAHYQFTLAQGVPAGGQLTFPWTSGKASAVKVNSFASGTSTAVIEQVSVTEGTDGQNLGHLTIAGDFSNNLNSIHRVRYGSNNYKDSAIRQWLNSAMPAGQVWTPQTKWDRPPAWAANVAGFMYGMDADFLATVGKTHIITASVQTIEGGAAYDEMDDYCFLLSRQQVYGDVEVAGVDEGTPYPYYSDYSDLTAPGGDADTNRITTRGDVEEFWWLRTPGRYTLSSPLRIKPNGGLGYDFGGARISYGVLPACNII